MNHVENTVGLRDQTLIMNHVENTVGLRGYLVKAAKRLMTAGRQTLSGFS